MENTPTGSSRPYQDTDEEVLSDDDGDQLERTHQPHRRGNKSDQSSKWQTRFNEDGTEDTSEEFYPRCDMSIWLRSCDKEQSSPVEGRITGEIPVWLRGILLRNGPGKLGFGADSYQHMFDGCALIHSFSICEGRVHYRNRFLLSKTFQKNQSEQRIVMDEFATLAKVADPCYSIFQRVASIFHVDHLMSDNAMISIYPIGGHYYALAETPYLHRIDTQSLVTLQSVSSYKNTGIIHQSAHPQIDRDGTVFTLGQQYTVTGPHYVIMKLHNETDENVFERATIVCRVKCRWFLHPCYMHSFSMTQHYFVLIEQPLAVNVLNVLNSVLLANQTLASTLRWYQHEKTRFLVVERSTGEVVSSEYFTNALFFLHTINAFETESHIVVDICGYRNADMLQCMYLESLQNAQKNSGFADMFRSRPLRYKIPLPKNKNQNKSSERNLNMDSKEGQIENASNREELSREADTFSRSNDFFNLKNNSDKNLRESSEFSGSHFYLRSSVLCDIGCEVPRINYENYNGRSYRFFYAISSDVDASTPGQLVKVDTNTKQCVVWSEQGLYPSEPIFVSRPNAQEEDDGVLLSALLNEQDTTAIYLLVLDAANMKELGRAHFICHSDVPKCLHGWFQQHIEQTIAE